MEPEATDSEDETPDATEEAAPPAPQPDGLPVVGLGASAGGIQALQQFFEAMPPDSDMAFVVVLHLSPEHESSLAAVLQQSTRMPVVQVTERVPVAPNRVYVIPPNKYLSMDDGHLRLSEPSDQGGRRAAIDLFFRTLAQTHGPQAVAVVLSGTGADGTLGLLRVKEMGGLALVQEPGDAEQDGMLRSAIATGMVDYVLPARDMPAQILQYRETSRRMRLPEEDGELPDQRISGEQAETTLAEILAHVRTQTGHDFTHYKRGTVLRRLGRRMQVNGQEALADYLDFMRRHPAEIGALLQDLLISVTNFFRDPEAWQTLEMETIPRLFLERAREDTVRAWVVGCATGEEAYSVAMLLAERAATLEHPPALQVFATDMDEDAIAVARQGSYPETIATDVSPERLRRWFHRDGGRYQIKKEIREIVLFAPHDVLKDTPFSRLDLITCRNLLIYLNRDAQARVFDIFHFALRPEGRLFLGASESAEGMDSQFAPTDKRHRIFVRRPVARQIPPLPSLPLRRPAPLAPRFGQSPRGEPASERRRAASLSALHQNLLELYAPPSVLVNEEYEVVHLSERAGRYLQMGGGEPSLNLIRAVHPDLALEMRAALYAASEGQDQVRRARARIEGRDPLVQIVVRPLREPEAAGGYFLVLFDEVEEAGGAPSPAEPPGGEPVARQLEAEIARLRAQLRSTVEQYEATTEELRASNEELQAINEELRSATEELETGREELQSVNEELITVNHELKSRVEEVGRANNDLQNLLASTAIGTIFLNRELRIQRYTPSVEMIFNIIPTDVGRPLAHITHHLDYETLLADVESVLARLATVEREVQSGGGRWYLARLLPYRTLDDRIDGMVLTFVDITQRRQAQEALRQSDERFRLLVDGARDYAMFLLDRDNRITFWSAGAERIFGWSEDEAVGQPGDLIFTPEDRQRGGAEEEIRSALARGSAEDRRWHVRKDGSRLWCDGVLTRLDDERGSPRGFVKVARDATRQWEAEEALRRAHDEMEQRVEERTATLTQTLAALEQALSERELAEAARDQLLRRLVTAEEEERKRIARELHDEMGQLLTGLLLGLQELRDRLPDADPRIRQLQEIADRMSRQIHDLALALRPTALDDIGLRAAVGNMVEEWSVSTGIAADFQCAELNGEEIPTLQRGTVYRVVQEALTNVARHAQAGGVSVILERRDQMLVAIVEDDGVGFDPEAVAEAPDALRHLGLLGMRERSTLIGGTLTVESSPGSGTTVFLRVPLSQGKESGEIDASA